MQKPLSGDPSGEQVLTDCGVKNQTAVGRQWAREGLGRDLTEQVAFTATEGWPQIQG